MIRKRCGQNVHKDTQSVCKWDIQPSLCHAAAAHGGWGIGGGFQLQGARGSGQFAAQGLPCSESRLYVDSTQQLSGAEPSLGHGVGALMYQWLPTYAHVA